MVETLRDTIMEKYSAVLAHFELIQTRVDRQYTLVTSDESSDGVSSWDMAQALALLSTSITDASTTGCGSGSDPIASSVSTLRTGVRALGTLAKTHTFGSPSSADISLPNNGSYSLASTMTRRRDPFVLACSNMLESANVHFNETHSQQQLDGAGTSGTAGELHTENSVSTEELRTIVTAVTRALTTVALASIATQGDSGRPTTPGGTIHAESGIVSLQAGRIDSTHFPQQPSQESARAQTIHVSDSVSFTVRDLPVRHCS